MKRLLLAAALAAVALAAPGVASAAIASAVTRDIPLRDARALAASAPTPKRFDLVGVSWRGSGEVAFRVRAAGGRWSAWMPAAPEDEDGPDRGAAESRQRPGWRLGNPWWVGHSTAIRFRVTGRVVALRATFVRSPEARIPFRMPSATASPAIVPRSGWGADESSRRFSPEVAPTLRLAVVHHTAGTNAYTQDQAAAIVRGIQTYHVKSNGWNDIGYNFLVDRFGTVYEGRYGGLDLNVVGAHAQGFNTGSVGVAVLGTYEDAPISAAAEKSLAELLAWRLDLAHVDPLSTLSFLSNGNARFPAGLPVFLRAVSGHRDTGNTACPGDTLHARLDTIATRARDTGLPKLFDPVVEGTVGALVRFRGRLPAPAPWTVRVSEAATGRAVAVGTGTGTTVDWTWDASAAPPGSYVWRMEGAPGSTPATGELAGSPEPSAAEITSATVDLDTISPNGDAVAERASVTYTISRDANVRADVLDTAGAIVASLQLPRWRRAGEHTVSFDGLGLPDGAYTVRLVARVATGVEGSADVAVVVTRTLAGLAVSPDVFAPTARSRPRVLGISFTLSRTATVAVRILREGRWVATPFSGWLAEGRQLVEWDGTKAFGTPADGSYEVVVEVVDDVATVQARAPFRRDTAGPTLRLVSRKPAVLAVGEAARISGLVNNARRAFDVRGAGRVRIPGISQVRTVALFARDAAGNLTTLRLRLD